MNVPTYFHLSMTNTQKPPDSHGWDIERDASFNVTQDFGLTLQPYIDFTVEFACEIFGGLIDLGTGVKAEPSFPFTTTFLAPSQGQPPDSQNTTLAPAAATYLNSTGGAPVYPNSTVARRQEVCASGVREDIAFQFDIIAFATKFLSTSLYVSLSCVRGCAVEFPLALRAMMSRYLVL